MYITKGYAETFLDLRKRLTKSARLNVNAVAAALYPSISELRGRHSQCQIAPRLPRSPDLIKCQVSDCH